MNVTITGASGFIGRRLLERLVAEKHSVHALSRNPDKQFEVPASMWDPLKGEPPAESLSKADVVVHLAGEPVAQRWTEPVKSQIRESRVQGTRRLVQALSTLSPRPQTLISASAIGIYGSRGDEILTENSSLGTGFLPDVCVGWERQADLAEALGMRVVKIRIGVVLGKEGGALAKMLPAFKVCIGGRLGSGAQWMSWIHLDDLVGLIRFAMTNALQGPVNGTAPNPVINSEFTKKLATTLNRPALFPVPSFGVKALFGEMSEVVLGSQRVLPRAAQAAGFRFQYPELGPALKNILA